MTPERWARAKSIFEAAIELEPSRREPFVRVAADGDEPLVSAVMSLLNADSTETIFPTPPGFPPSAALLKGRYRVERELGRGGLGVVFLARDEVLHGRPVVIKMPLERSSNDPWLAAKFAEEVKALALIDHPGVVGALDSGITADGRPFLVMQYVEGQPLAGTIPSEGMPLEQAAHLLRQIGQALGAAHAKGICHRDLKPANIMLRPLENGAVHVRLIDFGIASVREVSTGEVGTRVVGTLPYMAPEQLEGRVSQASDVWAMGVIAYELVTGRRPFVADSVPQLLDLQRAGPSIKPSLLRPALPEAAEGLILQALGYRPQERPASAASFGDTVAAALTSPSVPVENKSRRSSLAVIGTAPGTRRWATIWVAVAIVPGVLAVWMYRGRPASQPIAASPAAAVQTPVPAAAQKLPPTQNPDAGLADAAGERLFWSSISGSNDPRVFREYLSKYPNGEFAPLAKLKLQPPAVTEQTASAGPHSGEARLNPRDGLRYVWIPPGSFQMGCSPGDPDCGNEERPRHPVRLSRGLWLGQTEVTVEAWSRFAKASAREMPPESKEGSFRLNPGWAERSFPISNIDWNDGNAYCTWAGGRLPTEAEWEYAARAGSTQARYGPPDEIAWYANNSGKEHFDFSVLAGDDKAFQERLVKNENRMHPVATLRPNAFGLYDMLGNVNEWVNDWVYYFPSNGEVDAYYKESPELDPTGPDSPRFRTFRGGPYARDAGAIRFSARGARFSTNARSSRAGCRCALDQIPATVK